MSQILLRRELRKANTNLIRVEQRFLTGHADLVALEAAHEKVYLAILALKHDQR